MFELQRVLWLGDHPDHKFWEVKPPPTITPAERPCPREKKMNAANESGPLQKDSSERWPRERKHGQTQKETSEGVLFTLLQMTLPHVVSRQTCVLTAPWSAKTCCWDPVNMEASLCAQRSSDNQAAEDASAMTSCFKRTVLRNMPVRC